MISSSVTTNQWSFMSDWLIFHNGTHGCGNGHMVVFKASSNGLGVHPKNIDIVIKFEQLGGDIVEP
jgi:hypothetical protein